MKIFWLTWVNMKRLIKNYKVLLMIVVFPILLVGFIFYSSMTDDKFEKQHLAVYDRDNSSESYKFIERLKDDFNVTTYIEKDENEVYGRVTEGKEKEIYEIVEGFEKDILLNRKPKLKLINTGELSTTLIVKGKVDLILEEMIKGEKSGSPIKTIIEISKKENNHIVQFLILMICYFIIIGGGVIAEDLIMLRDQNIIKRSIVTANKDIEIIIGIFLSIFILQGAGTSFVLLILFNILNIKAIMIPQVILAVILCSAISTSVILATSRWIKTATAVELTIIVYGLISYLLTVTVINVKLMGGEIPKVVEILGKFTPFYWLNNIITNNDLLISILVILIMVCCFLTAGTFKLRDFARE